MFPTKERKAGRERNRRIEALIKGGLLSGDSVPRLLGFIALMPIPVDDLVTGASSHWPQLGLGPGVGARVAPQQSPILRSGRL
jgi:hypothetical protein